LGVEDDMTLFTQVGRFDATGNGMPTVKEQDSHETL